VAAITGRRFQGAFYHQPEAHAGALHPPHSHPAMRNSPFWGCTEPEKMDFGIRKAGMQKKIWGVFLPSCIPYFHFFMANARRKNRQSRRAGSWESGRLAQSHVPKCRLARARRGEAG